MDPIERRLLGEDGRARRRLMAAVLAGFLGGAALPLLLITLSHTIDRVFIGGQTLEQVVPLLWLMAALAAGRGALLWLRETLAQQAAGLIKAATRPRAIRHLFSLGPLYSRSRRGGELVNTLIGGVESFDAFLTGFWVSKWLAMLLPPFVLLLVLIIDPLTALVLIFAGPMLILLIAFIGQRTRDLTERRHEDLSWMSAFFLDILRGLPTLKMFGRSREQAANVELISREFGRSTLDVLRTAFQTSLALEWATTAATAMVALETSLRLMRGTLPFVEALAVLLLTPEFFFPLRGFAQQYHAGSEGKTAARRLYDVLDEPPPRPAAAASLAPAAPVPPADHPPALRFDAVEVRYDADSRPALSGFTLDIPAGSMVALVGPSGAGKSTAAALLLRFVEPSAGDVRVGAQSLASLPPAAWRQQIAWVPQLPHLFHGTVADNIRLARPGATADEVRAAAAAAHADEFIRGLPRGYDTPLGENGARLSGGQRRRLALARAFLRDAPLVILDEATSNLDAESEQLIREALARLRRGRTLLVIAHRLAMAAEADRIAVVEDGRVTATGPHDELAVRSDTYRRLLAAARGTQ